MGSFDLTIGIGGAAGQGVATPGNILAKLFSRRGLSVQSYNAYQSIIRGGHTFLILRLHEKQALSMGDTVDMMVALNQDTMNRHLKLMLPGSYVLYNQDKVTPGEAVEGVHLCGLPVKEKAKAAGLKGDLAQNTMALGAILSILGMDFSILEEILMLQFARKGEKVVKQNVDLAHAGYEYAKDHFQAARQTVPTTDNKYAVMTGNQALAMGAVAAGVKFYCAYPMSPSTGVLMWLASHSKKTGMLVRQAEDEIAVINAVIGAAHTGARSMCATSGGGFALMTEAIGMAGIMEIPMVCINVMRGGPSTGLPTKTEQGDLWQALGASQGDFPKLIMAPTDVQDAFESIPQVFNLVDKYQLPAIVLSELFISEGTATVPVEALRNDMPIERGALIRPSDPDLPASYQRYKITDSGISPRAVPGTPNHMHTVASDEHDEDGVLISDEFTNPPMRRAMVDKRARKMDGLLSELPRPAIEGAEDAEVTLVGWGSTQNVIREARQQLAQKGVVANQLHFKWLYPMPEAEILALLQSQKRIIVVELSHSGQFARFLRSETGFTAHGHIRKYDGEPFMPHHITEAVQDQLAGTTTLSIPEHEMMV